MIAALLIVLGSTFAPECPEEGKCAQPLIAGEAAPFDGIMLSTDMVVDVLQSVQRCEEQGEAALDRAKSLAALELDAEIQRRLVDANAYSAKEAAMRDALTAVTPAWYERPLIVAIVTATAVGFAAIGVSRLTE